MEEALIELDSRRRTALGRVGHAEHHRYLVEEDEDGTLIWRPAAVITEHELAFMRQHPDEYGRIRANRADPDASRRRARPARRSPRPVAD